MWMTALLLNIVHLVYHQVTTNVDLFPFNNIRRYKWSERMAEVTLNGLLMGFPVIALSLNDRRWITVAGTVLGFLVIGEFLTWWPFYFFGVPPRMRKWQEIYDRTHKHTVQCLPAIGNHPRPNLEHCILFILTIAAFGVTVWYRTSV